MEHPVTIVQIARESGVSISTVSRVLNGSAPVAQATRDRVNAVIARYHYTPNDLARSLINRRSMTLGVVMPDITNPYFSAMFQEIERAAGDAGYSVLLGNTSFSAARIGELTSRETAYFQMMLGKNVDGVLIAGGQADLDETCLPYRQALRRLAASVPTVVLGCPIEDIDCLFLQRERGQGVFAAVSYLASLGHCRIAFAGGEPGVGITTARLRAYREALDTLDLCRDPALVSLSDYYTPDGYRAARELLGGAAPFTAILAMNDNVALGAYRALADAGLRVPQDVSVVSCDQFYAADFLVPRLTSVDQHNEIFGRFVVQALLDVIHGTRRDVPLNIQPELIVRESCAPPAPASRWCR